MVIVRCLKNICKDNERYTKGVQKVSERCIKFSAGW